MDLNCTRYHLASLGEIWQKDSPPASPVVVGHHFKRRVLDRICPQHLEGPPLGTREYQQSYSPLQQPLRLWFRNGWTFLPTLQIPVSCRDAHSGCAVRAIGTCLCKAQTPVLHMPRPHVGGDNLINRQQLQRNPDERTVSTTMNATAVEQIYAEG